MHSPVLVSHGHWCLGVCDATWRFDTAVSLLLGSLLGPPGPYVSSSCDCALAHLQLQCPRLLTVGGVDRGRRDEGVSAKRPHGSYNRVCVAVSYLTTRL